MEMDPGEIRLPKLDLLRTWRDGEFRSAAANMALDEACLEFSLRSGESMIRAYHWGHAATTIGYFDAFPDRESVDASGMEIVRRFTGGGQVEHGEDATFALCLAPGLPASLARSGIRYQWIHEALALALGNAAVRQAALAIETTPPGRGPCFTAPVPLDLVDPVDGKKIAGGAQRRTRGAVLHQGSIRLPEVHRSPGSPWIDGFFGQLAETTVPLESGEVDALRSFADGLVAERYGNHRWNRRL